jgi:WD40 repeat protein
LLVNFDGHSDWVNQIKLVEEANTLISCSNDTTIKIWRLKSLDEYLVDVHKISKQGKMLIRSQGPFSSLNDHTDYVRTIDYSKQKGSLFSVSDDG